MRDRLVPPAPRLPLSAASTGAVLSTSPSTDLHVSPALLAQLAQLERQVQQLHQELDHRDTQLIDRVIQLDR